MRKSHSRAQKAPAKADSLRAAAGILGTTPQALRRAKEGGCPGFRSGRVDVALVKGWLAKHPIESTEPAMSPMQFQKFRKLKADADAKEFALAVKRGEYLLAVDVRRNWVGQVRIARSVLAGQSSSLALVLASLTGADPVAIEDRIKEANKQFIAEMHRSEWMLAEVLCDRCQSRIYEKTEKQNENQHPENTKPI